MMSDGRVHPSAPPSSSDFSGEMNHSASAYSSSDPSSSPLYSFHFEKPVHPPPALPHGKQQQPRHPQPQPQKPAPPQPGTYVVQVPKDKVFRVPPPENARLFQHYTRRAKRRGAGCSCLRACLYLLLALLCLAILLAVAVGVVYAVYQPRQPAYSVVSLAVSGLAGVGNASAPGAFSPGFEATIRADNGRNGKVGVQYDGAGSRVAVSYEGAGLAQGKWPAFYQAPGNVTVFVAKAKAGAGIRFSQSVRGQMAAAERLRSVPFDVDVEVPVRLELGGVKTWAVKVTVRCAMSVDILAANAKVVSRSCDVKVPFLFWRS
uniref:Uncharacterized protein n=1 Tax=Avena sativa TaxID=4498 RepID=A0ACD5W2F1_AVESA